MSTELILAGGLIFLAAFIAVEALLSWWNSTHSAEAKRIEQRLNALTSLGEGVDQDVGELIKKRARVSTNSIEGKLSRASTTRDVYRLLLESGSEWTVTGFVAFTVVIGLATLLICLILWFSVPASIACAVSAASIPYFVLLNSRNKRLKKFQDQLPAALDMIGRALRAGHSFTSALHVAGTEMNEPLGPEFRMAFDEINYGIPPGTALENLAKRVPSQDLSFFVIAAVIQRETGGNLAEVLDNISSIIRDRLKLFGQIHVISAEGRLSAWVLSLLPVFTAFIMYLINPELMSLLWTEPIGWYMIYYALFSIFVGIIWMRKVIRIHV